MYKIFEKMLAKSQSLQTFQMGNLAIPKTLLFWEQNAVNCILHPVPVLPNRTFNEIL